MISSNPVRGARDITPDEMQLRDRIENTVLEIYKQHGFYHIETPAIENLDLLLASQGGDNVKMLFTILKRGEKFKPTENSTVEDLCDMGLRFDLTLPLSRFYSNQAHLLESPFKAIQIGDVYRAERPQRGRFRSFKQMDIDIIGDETHHAEIELIDTTAKALEAVGFKDFVIKINDRKLLSAFIVSKGFKEDDIESICISLDKLDKIGQDGVVSELSEKGYEPELVKTFVQEVGAVTLESLADLKPNAVEELKNILDVIADLSQGAYQITFDFTLIRGMGYYTGPIFEVAYGPYGYSIAGGGRYDDMIGKYSKKSEPAVGFSIGFERIVQILMEEQKEGFDDQQRLVVFYNPKDHVLNEVIPFADTLREKGFIVNIVAQKKKFGRQIQYYQDRNYAGMTVFGRDGTIEYFNHG